MSRRVVSFAALLLIALGLSRAAPALAQQSLLADQVRGLTHHAQEGIDAAEHNQPDLMRAEYQEIEALWGTFEDQVREKDQAGYVDIEGALTAIDVALKEAPLDPAAVRGTFAHLKDEAAEVADRLGTAPAAPATAPAAARTPADLLKTLDEARDALDRGDDAAAAIEIDEFVRAWPAVEGAIATRDKDAYTAIEADLGRAAAAIRARPADMAAAAVAVARLRATLAPLTAAQTYTALDAAVIILREGLEALLVVVALLAFLRRSGNSDKRGWIWAGGALGVLASVVTAMILQAVFTSISAGQNRELIEGVTGLVAAALLFYVSYWLHSKSSLHAWQRYINARTGRALARGSMAGLALLSFLAVFREGAETTVFYLGMAPAIAFRDLLLGLGIGVGALVVAALLILVAGVKLPLRPFFRVAGVLVYYLGFKFVGAGIHSLQVAGLAPATLIPGLPTIPFLGFYPIWETALPQLVLLLGALAAFLYLRARDRRAGAANATITA
ncbi:MAG TPA: FTR1 family protein [Roseiflexaceae bacterium]